jgi:hypothetical protein
MKRPKISIAEQMYAAGIWERPDQFDGTADEIPITCAIIDNFDGTSDQAPMIDWSQENALQAFCDLVKELRIPQLKVKLRRDISIECGDTMNIKIDWDESASGEYTVIGINRDATGSTCTLRKNPYSRSQEKGRGDVISN